MRATVNARFTAAFFVASNLGAASTKTFEGSVDALLGQVRDFGRD
jgi:hypothetical protein